MAVLEKKIVVEMAPLSVKVSVAVVEQVGQYAEWTGHNNGAVVDAMLAYAFAADEDFQRWRKEQEGRSAKKLKMA